MSKKKDLNHFLCILRNPISVFQGMLHESGIIGQGRSAFLSDFSHLLHTQPQEKHPCINEEPPRLLLVRSSQGDPTNQKQKSYSLQDNVFPSTAARVDQVLDDERDKHLSRYSMPSSCRYVPGSPPLRITLPKHYSMPVQTAEQGHCFGNIVEHPSQPDPR